MTLTDQAHGRLITMILEGDLQPGDALHAEKLAESLGMSRTPVREALRRIANEGLAQPQGRFLRVRRLGPEEIEEIFFLRLELERRAAEAAVSLPGPRLELMRARVARLLAGDRAEDLWQVDDDFHAMIMEALGNPTIAGVVADLRRRSCMFDSTQVPARYTSGCREHLAILDALARGDAAGAGAEMAHHIRNARDAILARLGEINRRKTRS